MFKKKPIRLEKQVSGSEKMKRKLKEILYIIRLLLRTPEFWLMAGIIVIGTILVVVAINESISTLFYNNGINSAL